MSLLNLLQYWSVPHFLVSWPQGMWDLVPWPGIEPVHPALKGKVLTVEPPGKSLYGIFCNISSFISDFMYLSSRSFFLVSLAKILSILFINSKKLLNFLYPSIVILDSISFIVASSLLFPSSSNSGGFPVGSVVKNPPANAED